MISNQLRSALTVVGLVLFAWSFTAGDATAQGVRLEEMPELTARPSGTARTRASKSKLDLTPSYSRPEFGVPARMKLRELPSTPVRPSSNPEATSLPTTWDNRVTRFAQYDYSAFASLVLAQPATRIRRSPLPAAALLITPTKLVVTSVPAPVGKPTPVAKPKSKSRTVALRSSAPNLRALAERVESHNYSVTSIEQQLDEQEAWDLASIQSAVNQVEAIRGGQKIWSLYWELLDANDRRRMPKPFTLDQIAEKLRQRIFEVGVENEVQPESVSTLSADEAKERLESLDQRVSDWR